MEIRLRGWSRDMGTKQLVSHDLSQFHMSQDPQRTIRWTSPGMFGRYGGVTIAWGQDFKHQGSYRMDLEFTASDILQLFKASNGRELDVDLLEKGFTISPELKKRVLSEIKFADLTIGDLAKLSNGSAPATESKETQAEIKPFRRI